MTSRREILAAARELIERDGWERLTVRRLAAELSIGTTTLYHHVRDREDLLIQLLNEHADATLRPELPASPRERIIAAATAIHESLAAWPWAVEVLTADGFINRLGDSSLAMVEAIVAGAVDAGCTPEQAVHVFRSIWYFTVGEILVRAHTDPNRTIDDSFLRDVDAARLPRLAAIGPRWPAVAAQDTFAWALPGVVDGLLARADADRPGHG